MDAKYIKAMKPRDLTEEDHMRNCFTNHSRISVTERKKYWQAVSRWIRNMR